MRDEHGNWVGGFTRHIGSTNNFIAELWGLREGLLLCCNLNIDSLVVELDAQTVVEVFKNAAYVNNVISPLLDDCRHLVAYFQQIRFNHCYRQANRCAGLLARMGANVLSRFQIFFPLVVHLWTFVMPLRMTVMVCCSTGCVLF